jgi:hypothetical protein
MKTKITFLVILFSIAVAFVSFNKFQSVVSPHGGRVKPAGEYNIEMKNVYPNLYTFLLDKNNKPISNKGIVCKAKFIFLDSTTLDIPLRPFEKDGFSGELNTLSFYSCRIYYDISGKSISANFETENQIVEKK